MVTAPKTDRDVLRRLRVLWYIAPDSADITTVVGEWLDIHDRLTSGDYAAMTGLTAGGSRGALDRLVDDHLLVRGAATSRNAHCLPPA